MSAADEAYRAAEAAIARAKAEGATVLSFDSDQFHALDRIPPQIAELTGLQDLSLHNNQITDLAPLAGMTGMRTLSLGNTQITDLAPLAGITGLQTLDLSNTQITDLAPLAGMTRLQALRLYNTQITNLAPLAGMTGLQALYLHNSGITDLAPLAGMTKLETVSLDNTQITEFAPLAGMTRVQTLWLTNTRITNLAPLVGMMGLQHLSVSYTQITDLAPLAGMTGLQSLYLSNTQITDLAPLAELTGLQFLSLDNTQITDLAPLAGMTGLQGLSLDNTQITDLAPLAGMTGMQRLHINNTQITDLAQLAGMTGLGVLVLDQTGVVDLRPLAKLEKLGTIGAPGLRFADTPAIKRDKRLAELAQIEDHEERVRETLAYLRTLPPWPEPYTPAATPDGSASQPIGDTTLAQAQALSDLTPLAEELVQNPETGTFSVQYKPIEKPDLLGATLGQVADAIEDVLYDGKNGLNATSLDIRKLRRTLDRYSNDPQRVEMDFTTAHASIARQIACDELPPSDENLALLRALEEGAQGIRATDPVVAVNRRILQEQKLRELSPADIQKIADAAPVLDAITQGDLQEQMRDDVQFLTVEMQAGPPRLPGVTRDDAIIPGRDEAVRVFGRASRMMIALRRSPEMVKKLRESTGFQAAEILAVIGTIITLGIALF